MRPAGRIVSCGEGAGYAGGIMSAAVDGLRWPAPSSAGTARQKVKLNDSDREDDFDRTGEGQRRPQGSMLERQPVSWATLRPTSSATALRAGARRSATVCGMWPRRVNAAGYGIRRQASLSGRKTGVPEAGRGARNSASASGMTDDRSALFAKKPEPTTSRISAPARKSATAQAHRHAGDRHHLRRPLRHHGHRLLRHGRGVHVRRRDSGG
ncbi:MAG: hypothetical protein ACLVJH_15165 [Faecalibacterium prausnitzii]